METTLTPWKPGLGMTAFDDASNYMGPRIEGYFVYSTHRDDDCLGRSNYRCILRALNEEAEKYDAIDTVLEPGFRHWAVGWVDQIVLAPDAPESVFRLAEDILNALADYPVVDEEDFCELETEEANSVWEKCYNDQERIKYIRENRSQFDFHDYADLIAVARGRYFTGYASELLA